MIQGLKAGVVTGDDYRAVIDHAKKNGYAIPAVNCTMSTVTNACLEAAKKANSPMIIQFSNGRRAYNAGKGWKKEKEQKGMVEEVAGKDVELSKVKKELEELRAGVGEVDPTLTILELFIEKVEIYF